MGVEERKKEKENDSGEPKDSPALILKRSELSPKHLPGDVSASTLVASAWATTGRVVLLFSFSNWKELV